MIVADRKNGNRARLMRLAMTPADFQALKFVAGKHGHRPSAALRFCLHQQALRDKALGSSATYHESVADNPTAQAALAALVTRPRANHYYPLVLRVERSLAERPERLTQWSVRMMPADEAALGAIASLWATGSRAGAFRFAVRVQALLDGFAPVGGAWQ